VAEGWDSPFVVVVEKPEQFRRWLGERSPLLMGIQVEGLIGDPEVWALAAQGTGETSVDVVLADPASEFSALYRLVDVRIVRPVGVTVPARPGFLKAVRLAASLQLPVRLLPGQPDEQTLRELGEAMQFYLHDAMVEMPIEFFHSLFAVFRGVADGNLWTFLGDDPAEFAVHDFAGLPVRAPDFVETHLGRLLRDQAECANCRWRPVCAGYFKDPDPKYSCAGVMDLFQRLEDAANELGCDLASLESAPL
jgi:hypothetical protein